MKTKTQAEELAKKELFLVAAGRPYANRVKCSKCLCLASESKIYGHHVCLNDKCENYGGKVQPSNEAP